MLKAKVAKRKNGIAKKLQRNLTRLDNHRINVGHFRGIPSSGNDNLDQVDLLTMWAVGGAKGAEGVIKNPRTQWVSEHLMTGKVARTKATSTAIKQFSENMDKTNSEQKLLNNTGKALQNSYKKVFGKVGEHMPPNSKGKAMWWTGQLQNSVDYKVTKRGGS